MAATCAAEAAAETRRAEIGRQVCLALDDMQIVASDHSALGRQLAVDLAATRAVAMLHAQRSGAKGVANGPAMAASVEWKLRHRDSSVSLAGKPWPRLS